MHAFLTIDVFGLILHTYNEFRNRFHEHFNKFFYENKNNAFNNILSI